MAVYGRKLNTDQLVLQRGRDYRAVVHCQDASGNPKPFPPGAVYFELTIGADTVQWPCQVEGATAWTKVDSEDADQVPAQTPWQLVFLPDGEASGGDCIAMGRVQVQS